jgi:hypothetical protein
MRCRNNSVSPPQRLSEIMVRMDILKTAVKMDYQPSVSRTLGQPSDGARFLA